MDRTILYLADNTLDEKIADLCKKQLLKEAGDIPIVSVSQKPLDFGKNICVGEIGRSWMSLYKQQFEGLKAVKTKYVIIAEHDCLYTKEHFDFTPPTDDVFYYNSNCWFVQWGGNHPELNGMYSYWGNGRVALSQLICSRNLHLELVTNRLNLIENGVKMVMRFGDPGAKISDELAKMARRATDGCSAYLKETFDKYIKCYRHERFKTKIPNIDIRHGSNFTGPRRGGKRRYELPYWGKFEGVI